MNTGADSRYYDIVIIGSGAAGLAVALHLSSSSALATIAVLSKDTLQIGASFHAQGGIAAVMDPEDSIFSHVQDTLVAGAGLCNKAAVEYSASYSPHCIEWLEQLNVAFSTKAPSKLHLTREGGHGHRRIVHAADATGKAVHDTLLAKAHATANIFLFEHLIAIDLITAHHTREANKRCSGVYVMDKTNSAVIMFRAKFVILATGGASRAYLYSTNPDGACGDGVAMAFRAGCTITNMEFNQFHPTCLYHPQAKSFLISEALRGEGGVLLLPDGKRFMPTHDPRAELAPRDIVARAIDQEMKQNGIDCVFLDITHKSKKFLIKHFPTIYHKCMALGIDLAQQAIPVVPAAHYTCGGVETNLQGQTGISGLYAIGEVACTGLHGANRLASNSLLECLAFAKSAAVDITQKLQHTAPPVSAPPWRTDNIKEWKEKVIINHDWEELRRLMWDYVGIVRTDDRLNRALQRIKVLRLEIIDHYRQYRISNDIIELRNLVLVAELIVRSALERKESRGLHFNLDYPDKSPTPVNTRLESPHKPGTASVSCPFFDK